MMKKIVLPLMMLVAAPVFAQTVDNGDVQAQRQAQRQQRMDQHMNELVAKLGLDSAGAAKLKQTLVKYHTMAQPVRKELWQTFKAMRGESDEGRLSQLRDTVDADKQKLAAIRTARENELRQQLTPSQFEQLEASRRAAFGRGMHRHHRGGQGGSGDAGSSNGSSNGSSGSVEQ
jgi:hypothetical protein